MDIFNFGNLQEKSTPIVGEEVKAAVELMVITRKRFQGIEVQAK